MTKIEAKKIAAFFNINLPAKWNVWFVSDRIEEMGYDIGLDNKTGNFVILDEDNKVIFEIK